MLVADGVLEVTLLGQNVNSYGVEFGDRAAFAKLLRACGAIDGLERVRFTSPHPKDFTPDVIDAMAETPNVCHQLHMPLQSGSDRVLEAMRRSYRSERYLSILAEVRAAMPDAAITTDIIVGFPGETEDDFQQTLDVVAASRFAGRLHLPVLAAARHPGRDHARPGPARRWSPSASSGWRRWSTSPRWRATGSRSGPDGRGAGRRGRGPQGRAAAGGSPVGPGTAGWCTSRRRGAVDRSIRPGDVVTTRVTYAAPHHLVADGDVLTHRRTRAGDRSEAGAALRTPGVGLGMPSLGRPARRRRPRCRPDSAR